MSTLYDLDSRRISIREYAFGTPWYLMPLALLIKFLGIPIPGSMDDPPVETLFPFEVEDIELPEAVQTKFAPLVQELSTLGFHHPIYHAILHPLHSTKYYWASFLHSSGQSWARIHHRIWSSERMEKVYLFPMFFSPMDDGSFLASSAGKPDILMPDSIHLTHDIGMTTPSLWDKHRLKLEEQRPLRPKYVDDREKLREVIEDHHAKLRDYLLARKVIKPLAESEQHYLQAPDHSIPSTDSLTPDDAAVMVELDRIQNKQAQWRNVAVILAISLLLFVGAFRAGMGWDWKLIAMMIGVLLFHELGHYLAMRWFGYRNLKMFFIPFLGAAVTGRHYNVAGWKKAIVALMGPVPGIAVGAGLCFAGMKFGSSQVSLVGLFTLILNAFNLIPILPFDGGWVVHAVLFVRHPLLDVLFRFLAILGLFGLALLLDGDKILIGLSVLMLIGLPAAWRVAGIAHRLRKQEAITTSPDAHTIPQETVQTILVQLRQALPRLKAPKLQAQYVTQIFENMNSRPPGVLASLALLTVHIGSFLAAAACVIYIALNPMELFHLDMDLTDRKPALVYEQGHTKIAQGAKATELAEDARVTVIATYPTDAEAEQAFAKLSPDVPGQAALRWFGTHLFLTLPVENKAERESWLGRLNQQAERVIVVEPKKQQPWLRVYFEAPSELEAERLNELIDEYFSAMSGEPLIPPWSPGWQSLAASDVAQFRKARRTLVRLNMIDADALQNPEIQSILKWHRLSLFLRSNLEDQIAYMQKMDHMIELETKRLLNALKAEVEETVDHTMISLWEQRNKLQSEYPKQEREEDGNQDRNKEDKARLEAWEKKQAALNFKMAELMGQVKNKDGKPESTNRAYSIIYGNVHRQKQVLLIDHISFHNPAEGLPALAEWLCKQGCQVRYEIKHYDGMTDLDDLQE